MASPPCDEEPVPAPRKPSVGSCRIPSSPGPSGHGLRVPRDPGVGADGKISPPRRGFSIRTAPASRDGALATLCPVERRQQRERFPNASLREERGHLCRLEDSDFPQRASRPWLSGSFQHRFPPDYPKNSSQSTKRPRRAAEGPKPGQITLIRGGFVPQSDLWRLST